jgi:hypothetical protein
VKAPEIAQAPSGGRDQEDCGSKPAQANSTQDPISKKGLVEWLKVKFKSQYHKKRKKKKKILSWEWQKLALLLLCSVAPFYVYLTHQSV